MLEVIEQNVHHRCFDIFQLHVETDQQVVQHCVLETLSLESYQPEMEFSWNHLKGRLPIWREPRFLHA